MWNTRWNDKKRVLKKIKKKSKKFPKAVEIPPSCAKGTNGVSSFEYWAQTRGNSGRVREKVLAVSRNEPARLRFGLLSAVFWHRQAARKSSCGVEERARKTEGLESAIVGLADFILVVADNARTNNLRNGSLLRARRKFWGWYWRLEREPI